MAVQMKGDPMRLNAYVAGGAIKIGDLVTLNAAGQVVVAAASQALLGMSNAQAIVAGQVIQVADHPDQQYIISSSSSVPSAQTDFNMNYNIVANVTTGSEGNHTIDGASGATTATLPLKALQPSPFQFAAAGTAVCVINNHVLKGGTGTAGI